MRTAKPRSSGNTERETTWFAIALVAAAALLLLTRRSQATDPEAFLKSMSEGVSNGGGGSAAMLPVILAVVGVILLLAWLGTRERKAAKPRAVNHSRKLLKQVGRELGLAGAEIRQLKVLVDVHEDTTGEKLHSPLTLLLCPSLLAKALETRDARVDRATVARMARRVAGKK